MNSKRKIVEGKLDKNRAGFGFLIRDDGVKPDIYIKNQNQKSAMDNDLVRVEILSRKKSTKPEGRVVKVLKHSSKEFAGTLEKKKKKLRFIPLGSSEKIKLKSNKLVSEASHGDRVIVRIERMPSRNKKALGSVIKTLGPAGKYETEIEVTLFHSGVRREFDGAVFEQLKEADKRMKNRDNREDLTHLNCFTIDPEEAKDFDDAVSIEKTKKGYSLGVHIADVSHFVPEGTAIDREALKRGTSVYLVDNVIPMLPEKLSNDLCSLKPEEERLSLSVMVQLDNSGSVRDYRFVKSVIRSRRRFSYDEVDSLLEGKNKSGAKSEKDLEEMVQLAKLLRKKREKRGIIDFDFPELKIELNEDGSVKEVKREERTMSHRLIEEFMILANEVVASHLDKNKIPALYRIHEKPDAEKMDAFRNFVQMFGFTIPGDSKVTPGHLQKILKRIRESKEEVIISTMMLRSLQQAVYSQKNKGHFALASKNYTHFTSPIRRYPDLIIHRIISSVAYSGEKLKKYSKKNLKKWGEKLSEKERAAEDAERESKELKLMDHMKGRIGEVFTGIISGVTSFGVFVELPVGLEGLIHIKKLRGDYYIYMENEMALRGKNTGRKFKIGEEIEVKLVKVDMKKREVDFLPVK